MVTTSHEGAKAIIQYVLREAVESSGDLHKKVKIQENEVAKKLGFYHDNLFPACVQYLKEKELISTYTRKNDEHYALELTIAAVDFLEAD